MRVNTGKNPSPWSPDWTLQDSDPLGFSIAWGLSGTEAPTPLTSGQRIRFNLVGAGEGVTQIRVMATLVAEGATSPWLACGTKPPADATWEITAETRGKTPGRQPG